MKNKTKNLEARVKKLEKALERAIQGIEIMRYAYDEIEIDGKMISSVTFMESLRKVLNARC